ncbi:HAD domain in Swiss Army Knife RNA repair protein [compost metagenome]
MSDFHSRNASGQAVSERLGQLVEQERPSRLSEHDIVLFLDFDGVLHPDAVYRTRHGLELRASGQLLMHANVLAQILVDFPDVRIALSTSWVRSLGFRRARAALPLELQARTVSATWHSAMPQAPLQGYDLQTRYQQIRRAVAAARLTTWLAIDDDPEGSWPAHDVHLVRCDSQIGLGDPQVQAALHDRLKQITKG